MSKQTDDLEAVRIIAEALKDFDKSDQERIIRWARERVGLDPSVSSAMVTTPQRQPTTIPATLGSEKSVTIKEFIESKNPRKDIHFSAVVAYYYRFEASEGSKKDAINSDDLQEACRLSNRNRFEKPIGVLNNAEAMGLLDRQERGLFKINAVGENLVAMGLPASAGNSVAKSRPVKTKRANKKKKAKR